MHAIDIPSWLATLPKVELHLHLEGAIPLPALHELVRKYSQGACPSEAELRERFSYRDFPHFIETWVWKNGYLREADDFAFIAEAVARSLAAQHHVYVEAFYSPVDFASTGLSIARISEAIRRGLARVPELRVRLVADLVRDLGPAQAERTLDELLELAPELDVVGVGLGGSEQDYPPELFEAVFRRAREAGLHVTAHAGEAAGAASVRGALDVLGAERIGHGTRALEDPALVERLRAEAVPIECCPLSNVRTAVIPELGAHPVAQWLRAGLVVCVNTDDPAMFHNSMAEEYAALMQVFGLDRDEILQLREHAVAAAWLSPAEKNALRGRLRLVG